VSSKLEITPAECRLRAAECHKMGQNARRPHVRDTLAQIERMWNRLAIEAEVSESMLTRFLEGAAFGPDDIAIMVAAYEAGLTQINVSGHMPRQHGRYRGSVHRHLQTEPPHGGRAKRGAGTTMVTQSWITLSEDLMGPWPLTRRLVGIGPARP
jgi:hypothetical protein